MQGRCADVSLEINLEMKLRNHEKSVFLFLHISIQNIKGEIYLNLLNVGFFIVH